MPTRTPLTSPLIPEPAAKAQQLVDVVLAWRRNPRHRGRWSKQTQQILEQGGGLLAPALLDLLLLRFAPDGRSGSANPGYGPCLELLDESLTQLRYAVERQRPWAIDLVAKVQEDIAARAFTPEVDVQVHHDLIQALHGAKLEIHPAIMERAAEVATYYGRFSGRGAPPDLENLLTRLIGELPGRTAMEMVEPLLAQMEVMPPDAQVLMISTLLAAQQPLMNELGSLFLLHPKAEVRIPLATWCAQPDGLQRLGPLGLRRLIGLRNWLPVDERPALDALIRAARLAGIASSPLEPARPFTAFASPFDGSGAAALWVFAKEKRHYRIMGVLVKQGLGIREVWGETGYTKRDVDAQIQDMTRGGSALPVGPAFLSRLVAHFVSVGQELGQAPPPQLLALNELAGGDYWKPEALDPAALLAEWEAAEPASFSPARVQEVLAASQDWPVRRPFASSWFEDDARVDAILRKQIGKSRDGLSRLHRLAQAILTEVVEPKRAVWTERLVWMALWARAGQGQAPVRWQDLAVLARVLHQGTPLETVPLMQAIALRSLESAFNRGQQLP